MCVCVCVCVSEEMCSYVFPKSNNCAMTSPSAVLLVTT